LLIPRYVTLAGSAITIFVLDNYFSTIIKHGFGYSIDRNRKFKGFFGGFRHYTMFISTICPDSVFVFHTRLSFLWI